MKLDIKLYSFIGGITVLAFVVYGFYLNNEVQNRIDTMIEETITDHMFNFTKMTQLEINSKRETVVISMNLASDLFKSLGNITETSEQVQVGDYSLNKWIIAGRQVQNDFSIVDRIKSFGVATSTIFQKQPTDI